MRAAIEMSREKKKSKKKASGLSQSELTAFGEWIFIGAQCARSAVTSAVASEESNTPVGS